MSCDRNGKKAGAAGVKAGLSSVSSKTGNIVGALSNRVLNVIDRDGILAKATRNPVRRYTDEPLRDLGEIGLVMSPLVFLWNSSGLSILVHMATIDVASDVAKRINPDKERGPLSQHFVIQRAGILGKKEGMVEVYRDKKRPNTRVFSLSSTRNWESRIYGAGTQQYTQLVAKTMPRKHYYFKGQLLDRDAVQIAAGQQKAEKTPGYAGMVSYRESLSPTWAALKHGMVRASLATNDEANRDQPQPARTPVKRKMTVDLSDDQVGLLQKWAQESERPQDAVDPWADIHQQLQSGDLRFDIDQLEMMSDRVYLSGQRLDDRYDRESLPIGELASALDLASVALDNLEKKNAQTKKPDPAQTPGGKAKAT